MNSADSKPSLGARIVRASLAVGVAHLIFKVCGVVQAIVVGRYLDGGTFDVVYAFAFEGCIFSIYLIGEEVIGPAFLPVFMRELDDRGESAAWRFANVVFTVQALLLVVVTALIMLFPDQVIHLFTNWRDVDDPDKHARYQMARHAVVWMAPALICLSLGSTTYMILNGYKRFFLAAFGDASWKICVLVAVFVGMGVWGMDYEAIIFGLLAGSAAKLLTHLVGLLREIRFFRPSLWLRQPAVRTMLWLMLPLIAGILFAKVRDVFNNVKILSLIDTEGLMKANSFGRKLYSTIGWLLPYTLSIAMFPFFCELVDKDDRQQFARVLTTSGRMLLAFFIPVSLVCVVLAEPISSVLFHGGKFTATEVGWTAISMACYILVLPGHALEYLLMQAFFAHRKMVSVTVIGIVFSAISMAVSYVGIVVCGARDASALIVIALGYTVSRTGKAVALIVLLRRQMPLFPAAETGRFLLRAGAAGLVSAGLCWVAVQGFDGAISTSDQKLIVLARLLVGSAGAAAGFLASTWLFRLQEPMQMVRWTMEKLRRRG